MRLPALVFAAFLACWPGSPARSSEGGSIRVTLGTAPDSLDPPLGNNTQAHEVMWLVNLGLLTYRHAPGIAGTQVVPALAQDLPVISNEGRTYTLRLRPGLVFPDGTAVKASNFTRAIERAIRLNWGGKTFFVPAIVGSAEFDRGSATSVSGIHTDDRTGTIVIELTDALATFSNILALPALGLIPDSTPDVAAAQSPPGVGPYQIAPGADITRSFRLVRNPRFAALKVPNVPVGHLDEIVFDITANKQTAAEDVLDGRADVFDAYDTLPTALLEQIRTRARGRYARHNAEILYYIWLNVNRAPFSDERVRQAISLATDRRAMQRLGSGMILPECYIIPTGMPGHPESDCPFADRDWKPDLERARQLVRAAGMQGMKVTIWGQQDSPGREWAEYLADIVAKIGLDANLNILANSVYYAVVGNAATRAQMGLGRFDASFPDPSSIFIAVDGRSIFPTNTYNLGRVSDPHIQQQLTFLESVPAGSEKVLAQWVDLGRYVTDRAYIVPWGSQLLPQLYSERMLFTPNAFHPIFGNDWSLLERK